MRLRVLHWPATPESVGPGAPDRVVLLHGLGDTADVWRPLMTFWRPVQPVLAFDLPGHGRSSWLLSDGYDVAALAGHVATALGEHGVCRPLLVGHSLGARISIELAARFASAVQGCILIDMGIRIGSGVDSLIADHIDALRAGRSTMGELATLILGRLPLADPDAVGTVVSAMAARSGELWHVPLDPAIKRLLARMPDEAVFQALARVPGPVGLVRGAYSAVLSREGAVRITTVVPRQPVPVLEVPMAGHAIPLEQPAALARALDGCLAGMPRPGRSA